ncbi:MAG: protein-L-isoaspartate(D-aspartate) O-methyltransferase [Candidatus Bathyarchaeota archaeon]|nr:protein-L-isoaspartate(D-aspartate) O-methyltransferase [Candidatus Bathyarchaeota archaeon]
MKTLVSELVSRGRLKTPEIIRAFEKIDRVDFMDTDKDLAYIDNAFPIGHGQTISQPTTVAIMFELLQPKGGDKVLDIGSGSGWTTALLANIVGPKGKVYSIEIIKKLYQFGKENVEKYDFKNVEFFCQDGSKGLSKHAPFDKILASASVPEIPPPFKKQLKINGIAVLPVRDSIFKVIKKTPQKFETEGYPFFVFVPMRGKYGKKDLI